MRFVKQSNKVKEKNWSKLLGLTDSGLDNTDSDGLSHITDGETTKRRIISVSLEGHGLRGNHFGDHSLTALDNIGVLTEDLTGSLIHFLKNLIELAGNVGSVAIDDGAVAGSDTRGVGHDDDLSLEGGDFARRIVLGITADVTSVDILDGDVLDVETDVITRKSLGEGLVVHFDGLDFSGDTDGGEGDGHTGLHDTGLDSTDGDCTNTTDLVDILKGKTEWLIDGSLGLLAVIDGLEKSGSLVPGHVGRRLEHVITLETGDGDEGDTLLDLAVTDTGEETGHFGLDFVVSLLRVLDGLIIHLIDGADHLLDTEGVSKKSVLSGLTVLTVTGFELTSTSGNDENGKISLGGTSDHVLDEISVAGGINDGADVLLSLELPEGNIDGDTTLSLSLQLIEDPSVLEGTLTDIVSFLLESLDGSLINTTASVDEVTGSSGLTGIDVTNDDQVNMRLFLTHLQKHK